MAAHSYRSHHRGFPRFGSWQQNLDDVNVEMIPVCYRWGCRTWLHIPGLRRRGAESLGAFPRPRQNSRGGGDHVRPGLPFKCHNASVDATASTLWCLPLEEVVDDRHMLTTVHDHLTDVGGQRGGCQQLSQRKGACFLLNKKEASSGIDPSEWWWREEWWTSRESLW